MDLSGSTYSAFVKGMTTNGSIPFIRGASKFLISSRSEDELLIEGTPRGERHGTLRPTHQLSHSQEMEQLATVGLMN